MQILIIGAGDVGSNVACDLSESHDLTIIDRDAERVDERFERRVGGPSSRPGTR